jgi:hypothetical protein
MIKGKSIVELAQELQNQIERKKDFVADTREIEFSHNNGFELTIPGVGGAAVNDHTHAQISARLGVPKGYYDRLRKDHPQLLVDNVATLFREEPERRMIRTVTNPNGVRIARAFLSDRYRRVDNEQIAEAALPALIKADGIEIVSCDVTDKKLYIQARFPKLEGEVKVGDPVQAGLIITNSEIGLGALEIRPLIYRLVCTNGLVVPRDLDGVAGLRKQHVGRKVEGGEDYTVYSDETLQADDHALMLKIRDQILALSNPELFLKLVEQMRKTTEGPQVQKPVRAVEELAKAFQLPQKEQDSILESLIRGGDYSRWGVLNAVTAQANEQESYDRAVELEQLGGSILTLPAGEWQRIAEAA